MSNTTPGNAFVAATTAFQRGDVDGWLAQCHDDVVLQFPYAAPGRPARVEGKAAVREYLSAVPGRIAFDEVTDVLIHQSVDPDTAIVEWSATGHLKDSGAPYSMSYVVVLTLVDGLIAVYRDYWNPLLLADALDAP